MKEFPEMLKELLTKHSQKELGIKFGVSQNHIGKLSRGEVRGPNFILVRNIEDYYFEWLKAENKKVKARQKVLDEAR